MTDETDALLYAAIKHGVLAGGLRHYAARDQRIASGFSRAADLQSAKSADALDQWCRIAPNREAGDL